MQIIVEGQLYLYRLSLETLNDVQLCTRLGSDIAGQLENKWPV
jgi:hypothetical protein